MINYFVMTAWPVVFCVSGCPWQIIVRATYSIINDAIKRANVYVYLKNKQQLKSFGECFNKYISIVTSLAFALAQDHPCYLELLLVKYFLLGQPQIRLLVWTKIVVNYFPLVMTHWPVLSCVRGSIWKIMLPWHSLI